MAKIFGKCKLCKAQKFLNYEELCKRCAKNPESISIQESVAEHEKADAKFEAEMKKHDANVAKETIDEITVEEKDEKTDDEDKGKDAKSDEKHHK